jgi:isopenicillin N synthase-like dioxygenase
MDWMEEPGEVMDPVTREVIEVEKLEEQELPVADIRDARNPLRRRFWVDAVSCALEGPGFFQVIGHDVTSELLQEARTASAKVYALPDHVKKKYERPDDNFNLGYGPLGCEKAEAGNLPNLMAYWMTAPEGQENIMPAEVPEFAKINFELMRHSHECGQATMAALQDKFNPAVNLVENSRRGENRLRNIMSPDLQALEKRFGADVVMKAMRSFPHEDVDALTVMFVQKASGLIIKGRNGKYATVRTQENVAVVDTGMQIGWWPELRHLTPTRHAVLRPWGEAGKQMRLSFPYFLHMDPDLMTPDGRTIKQRVTAVLKAISQRAVMN